MSENNALCPTERNKLTRIEMNCNEPFQAHSETLSSIPRVSAGTHSQAAQLQPGAPRQQQQRTREAANAASAAVAAAAAPWQISNHYGHYILISYLWLSMYINWILTRTSKQNHSKSDKELFTNLSVWKIAACHLWNWDMGGFGVLQPM